MFEKACFQTVLLAFHHVLSLYLHNSSFLNCTVHPCSATVAEKFPTFNFLLKDTFIFSKSFFLMKIQFYSLNVRADSGKSTKKKKN